MCHFYLTSRSTAIGNTIPTDTQTGSLLLREQGLDLFQFCAQVTPDPAAGDTSQVIFKPLNPGARVSEAPPPWETATAVEDLTSAPPCGNVLRNALPAVVLKPASDSRRPEPRPAENCSAPPSQNTYNPSFFSLTQLTYSRALTPKGEGKCGGGGEVRWPV